MTHHEKDEEKDARNDGREPMDVSEQDAPEPVRPERVDEEAGEGLQERENPPQAEGPPDRA